MSSTAKAHPGVETTRDGHERKFVKTPDGRCQVQIHHRLTAKGVTPEHWNLWEVWGEAKDEATARADHDYALEHGPWGRPATA